ncbi:MAG: cobyric acid synthase [Chloroflexales bacterium]|nr:cobyric acid synthase [Chloroflexales bacterium]
MSGKVLMVQGTMSSVGKSLLVAALCRIFKQDGWRVAPFKAQNMALNSYVTRDGREIGRAQAMQAAAAGIDVTVEMNPVLIKPEADSFAQIVVMGRPWARQSARDYFDRRQELWATVTGALDSLRAQYDLVIIEGAGSPVELNLRRGDLVNMAIAAYADAPVLLAGDIDRGGIFAQLLGTLMLLDPSERARVRGLIVNKFRGDIDLFADGVTILEQRGAVPVLGVVPFIRDLQIADEDSVALDERQDGAAKQADAGLPIQGLDIVVIRLPHISNFDDFDPLRAEAGVKVRFVDHPADLGYPDLIIVPGTKTTVADLAWMGERGLAQRIVALVAEGVPVLGICGGYQMLGVAINDPLHVESDQDAVEGLRLLPLVTTFAATKQTLRAEARVLADYGLFAGIGALAISGYEIHMGDTAPLREMAPFLQITKRGDQSTSETDGTISADGRVVGTYLHGLFDNDGLRHAILRELATRKGLAWTPAASRFDREAAYEQLAATVRASLDLKRLQAIVMRGD